MKASAPKITVFGGSSPQPGSPAYEEALELGRLLGQRGFTVLTGGYIGTMEAVSRGCAEAGGHVIGVTCGEIEAWRPVKPNAWVQEEWRRPTLQARLDDLINAADAWLALPGGPGTLTEIALTWNRVLIRAIPPRPLILIGAGWRQTFHTFFSTLDEYVHPEHRSLLSFASDPAAAAAKLVSALGQSRNSS